MINTKTLAKYFHPAVEVHDGKGPRENYNLALPAKAWRLKSLDGLAVDEDGNVTGLYAVRVSADGQTPKPSARDGKPYLSPLPPLQGAYLQAFNLAPTSHDKPDAPNTSEREDLECPVVIPEGYELAWPDPLIDGTAYEWGAPVTVRKIGAVAQTPTVGTGGGSVDLSPVLRGQEALSDQVAALKRAVEQLAALVMSK